VQAKHAGSNCLFAVSWLPISRNVITVSPDPLMELIEIVHAWIAVVVTALVFVALQLRRGAPTDLLFLGGLMVVTLTGVLTPEEAFAGFANPALLTIAALLVVSAGLRSTGVLDWVGNRLLGRAQSEQGALWRLAPTLICSSAFILNTALVAMMMPVVMDWCRRRNVSPARLMIPLSYLTILGGVCTLIGTSTTLIVGGILRREGYESLGLFELGYVGFPCAVVGALFLLTVGPRLLPRRADIIEELDETRRDYLVEVLVQPGCPLIGQTVQEAGLRRLPGLFLIEIDHDGDIVTPVAPEDRLQANDRLVFEGLVNTIVDLEKIPGLIPAADMNFEVHPTRRTQRRLTEVVLSKTSPLIGSTVREGNFRSYYNAAVVAVHRNGQRVTHKIGDIRLEPGDTLLLQTRHDFVAEYQNNRDFYLVSPVEGSEPRLHHKMTLAASLALVLIGWLIVTSFLSKDGSLAGLASTAVAAITVAGIMIVTHCLRATEARASLDLQTLVTIAAALGLGAALDKSGAAGVCARWLVDQAGGNPELLLVVVYLLTLVFTEMITNNAVAAMLLPIALQIAAAGGYSARPFIIAITLAASLSFITPIGYQTNLMVMGPGGYRPSDYLRCGLPLAVLVSTTALLLIPRIWTF
jgi:di/tricarboxylate transporter